MSSENDTKTLEQTINDLKKHSDRLPFDKLKFETFVDQICRKVPLTSESFNLSVYTDDSDNQEPVLVDSTFVVSPSTLSNCAPALSEKLNKMRVPLRKTCKAENISYIFNLAFDENFSHYSFPHCFNPSNEGMNLVVKPVTPFMVYVTECKKPDQLQYDQLLFLDNDEISSQVENIQFKFSFDSVIVTCAEYASFLKLEDRDYIAILLDEPAMKYIISLREQ